MKVLYQKYAKYYDAIYSGKDYGKETDFLEKLFKRNGIKGKDILEVGCGTGTHTKHLISKGYRVTGVDMHNEMLAVARKKVKKATFRQGDMRTLRIGKKFDVILCLFSVMHYNQNISDLKKTINNFHSHLKPGGLLVFDMGFNEERWEVKKTGYVEQHSVGKYELVRYSRSSRKGKHGFIHMGYILYNEGRMEFCKDDHKIGIFKTADVKKLVTDMGFDVNIFGPYVLRPWNRAAKEYSVFAARKR